MKISSIRTLQNNSNKYSVYIDGHYALNVSASILLKQKLSIGLDISKERLDELMNLSAQEEAYASALNFISIRPRSVWEMRQYLKKKAVPAEYITYILNKLSNIKLLDDYSFTRAWVDNRQALRPTSRRRLEQELRQKHVEEKILRSVLDEYTDNDLRALRHMITKKRKLSTYKNDTVKLTSYLVHQGFSYDDVKQALDDEHLINGDRGF